MTHTILGSPNPPHAQWHADGLIGGHPGDATYGWTIDDLLDPEPLPPQPDDFVEFWHGVSEEADALEPSLRMGRRIDAPEDIADTHDVFEARYTSIGGRDLGAWVVLPKGDVEPTLNLTFGHGYGGRAYPELFGHCMLPTDATILPCVRGMPELSLSEDLPSTAQEHVLVGIESKETYVLRGCVADLWRATAELDHLVGVHRRAYHGGSFGGGLGAFALMGGRYARGTLHVPTFGNHPLRVTLPSIGSGAALSKLWETDPSVLDVLAYFDAATAASHVQTPTMVSIALWDPAVPPPGQVAVHHALAGEKHLVIQDCGHTGFPGEPEQVARWQVLLRDWMHQ